MTGSSNYRIIGGQWRSRKLAFQDAPGLRPTPDRVRETVFNWLQGRIEGAHCLDLFAGSGAMGFEALSRHAASVIMVDNNKQTVRQLQANNLLLEANATVLQADALQLVREENRFDRAFDIVFLDPPYHEELIAPCCDGLERNHFLKPESYLYIESENDISGMALPAGFSIIRNKKAGNVHYHLVKRVEPRKD